MPAKFEILHSGYYHTASAREGNWAIFREEYSPPRTTGFVASVTDGLVMASLELVKVIKETEA